MNPDKRRQRRKTELAKKKHEEALKLPVNKYLNAKEEDGSFKYGMADKIMRYYVDNPDPILDSMRLANALLHEVRWRKEQSVKYLMASGDDAVIEMKDKNGDVMSRKDCYLAHISETQGVHLVLSKLRQHLAMDLLGKADGTYFSFEQYDEFVRKVDGIVSSMGLVLFPDRIELIEPK